MTLTDDSIKYLSKGEWPNLTKLYLRILKVKIRLSENNPLFPDSFSDS